MIGKWQRRAFQVGGAGLAAHLLPSVLVLGSWLPLRSFPLGICRWRGPRALGTLGPGPLQTGDIGQDPSARRCTGGGGAVALTFDDGPHPEGTPAVLEALDRLGLRATFFCLGSLIGEQPALVGEIARRGHQIETHGYRHEHHLLRSPSWVRSDVRAAVETMGFHGLVPKWYRPSYGQISAATVFAAKEQRLETVLWSAWGREWLTDDPVTVAASVIARLEEGAIVLLHDNDAFGRERMWETVVAALPTIAAELKRLELHAVTLDQLVSVERSSSVRPPS